jgi:hypothetical protein
VEEERNASLLEVAVSKQTLRAAFRLRRQDVDLKHANEAGKVETALDSIGFSADS